MTHEQLDGAAELAAAGYAWEIADAPLLHDGLNAADLAHALELVDLGVLPEGVGERLVAGVVELAALPVDDIGYSPELGEVYTSREHRLRALIGEDAGWLHAGRTRREAVRTAWRICVRQRTAALAQSARELGDALCQRAVAEVDTVMPDYTYLQPAQPTTLGHYLLSFVDPIVRDLERLSGELARVDASPAGSGAANGSALPIDRQRMAEALGFASAVDHLRDAMWQTDPFLHSTLDATSLVLTADRLAEDLEILASREFGFVSLGDGLVRPSVLMPQKRNPYALSVVRGTAAILVGRATGQLALAKSPSARSDAHIYGYGEVPRSMELATRVLDLMAAVVRTLHVDRERMRQALDGAHLEATDVATLLTTSWQLDYASAHAIVADAIRDHGSIDAQSLAAAGSVRLGRPVGVDADELAAIADPARLISRRALPGGPSATEVARLAADRMSRLAAIAETMTESTKRWADAERTLADRARRITQGRT